MAVAVTDVFSDRLFLFRQSPIGIWSEKGNILLENVDFTKGDINKEEIIAHAVSMGLIEDDMELSEADIFDLVFHPGFSTAK